MSKQTLVTEMITGKTFLEVDGDVIEITDPELFETVNNLAAYNAALGNNLAPSFWSKLFSFGQRVENKQPTQNERPAMTHDYSEPVHAPQKEAVWNPQPDGWDNGTPIYGGEGWC